MIFNVLCSETQSNPQWRNNGLPTIMGHFVSNGPDETRRDRKKTRGQENKTKKEWVQLANFSFFLTLIQKDPRELKRGQRFRTGGTEGGGHAGNRTSSGTSCSPFEISVLWASVQHGLHYKLVPSDRERPCGTVTSWLEKWRRASLFNCDTVNPNSTSLSSFVAEPPCYILLKMLRDYLKSLTQRGKLCFIY